MSFEEHAVGSGDTAASADSNVTYHAATGSYRTEFDHETRSPSEAVVTAMATVRDMDPLDLPPLATFVSPDGLDEFLLSVVPGEMKVEGTVTFEYADHIVTVKGHGTVIIE